MDGLNARLRDIDARYMALLKSVADGVAMRPKTVILEAPAAQPTPEQVREACARIVADMNEKGVLRVAMPAAIRALDLSKIGRGE